MPPLLAGGFSDHPEAQALTCVSALFYAGVSRTRFADASFLRSARFPPLSPQPVAALFGGSVGTYPAVRLPGAVHHRRASFGRLWDLPVPVMACPNVCTGSLIARIRVHLAMATHAVWPIAYSDSAGTRTEGFRSSIPGPPLPSRCFGVALTNNATTWGQYGLLALYSMTLSFTAPCRFNRRTGTPRMRLRPPRWHSAERTDRQQGVDRRRARISYRRNVRSTHQQWRRTDAASRPTGESFEPPDPMVDRKGCGRWVNGRETAMQFIEQVVERPLPDGRGGTMIEQEIQQSVVSGRLETVSTGRTDIAVSEEGVMYRTARWNASSRPSTKNAFGFPDRIRRGSGSAPCGSSTCGRDRDRPNWLS